MPSEVSVAPLAADELEELLPLIAAYQRFYRVEDIDEERNRAFFRRFVAPSEDGMIIAARRDGALLGYACLYWSFSSTRAVETVVMNDLYVVEEARAEGVGRALLDAAAAVGRERGAHHMKWTTEPDNLTAQGLYDSTAAERSEWVAYDLKL